MVIWVSIIFSAPRGAPVRYFIVFLLSEGYPEERRTGILQCFCSQRGTQRSAGQVFYSVFAIRGVPRGAPDRYFTAFLLSEGVPRGATPRVLIVLLTPRGVTPKVFIVFLAPCGTAPRVFIVCQNHRHNSMQSLHYVGHFCQASKQTKTINKQANEQTSKQTSLATSWAQARPVWLSPQHGDQGPPRTWHGQRAQPWPW